LIYLLLHPHCSPCCSPRRQFHLQEPFCKSLQSGFSSSHGCFIACEKVSRLCFSGLLRIGALCQIFLFSQPVEPQVAREFFFTNEVFRYFALSPSRRVVKSLESTLFARNRVDFLWALPQFFRISFPVSRLPQFSQIQVDPPHPPLHFFDQFPYNVVLLKS